MLDRFFNWRVFSIIFGFYACATFFDPSARAQSETEAKFVLQDIRSWLPGQYDNDPQVYLETAFGTSEAGPHARGYVVVTELPSDTGEGLFFHLRYHDGGRHQDVAWQQVWQFEAAGSHVAMRHYDIDEDENIGSVTELGEANCRMRWMRGLNEVFAVGQPGECLAGGAVAEIRLSADGLWIMNMGRNSMRTDRIPFKYSKARDLECFVYVMHDKTQLNNQQEDRTVLNPIYLHDRGDTLTFQTKETDPRMFTLHLRRSMWASRSGRNFVPLLSLTLYAGQDTGGAIEGNAWADGNSTRVGFDAGARVGARCKHYTERRPEAKP